MGDGVDTKVYLVDVKTDTFWKDDENVSLPWSMKWPKSFLRIQKMAGLAKRDRAAVRPRILRFNNILRYWLIYPPWNPAFLCDIIFIHLLDLPFNNYLLREPNLGRRIRPHHPGGSHRASSPLSRKTWPLRFLPCLLSLPPGQGVGLPGEWAGGRAGEPRWCLSTAGGTQSVEPGVVAEKRGPEGCGAAVRVPEEGMPTSRLRSPAGSDAPAPSPCGYFLPEWLLLSSVKEGSWYQLCRWYVFMLQI